MSDKCAPGKNFNEGSCFTVENLTEIAKAYNTAHPNKRFKIKKNKKYLLKNLTKKIKEDYNCNDEMCWLDTNLIKDMENMEISHFTLRPNGPKKKYEWLSTTDINNVMIQYEQQYSDFKFLGAVPYDFEELTSLEVYNIDFQKLLDRGISRIGMVINLDEHYKSGSHWVGLFANLLKKKIYYFDSFAKKPEKRIRTFIKKIISFIYNKDTQNKLDVEIDDIYEFEKYIKDPENWDIRYNKIRHQFSNSECGVYSMNFIIRLLHGETFDYIVQNVTKDEAMNACRNVYFRNV